MTQPPEWNIAHWLNAERPLSLASLRGKAVLAVAFQMLCPGCVSQGLPQAKRARALFSDADLAVVGLHTVFEHHEAQGGVAPLKAFLHEYRIAFPVGVDAQQNGPVTMRAYGMRGTPTTLLYDRAGNLRLHQFGHVEDMALGAALMSVIGNGNLDGGTDAALGETCGPEGCA